MKVRIYDANAVSSKSSVYIFKRSLSYLSLSHTHTHLSLSLSCVRSLFGSRGASVEDKRVALFFRLDDAALIADARSDVHTVRS